MSTAFIGIPLTAGLNFHWRLLPGPPPVLAALGLVLVAFGWIMEGPRT